MIKKYCKALPFVLLIVTLFTLGSLWGCSTLDRVEPTPSYLYVKKFELTTLGDNSQGSSASDIVDGWVYINGNLVGVFELPAMVPVLYEKTDDNDVEQIITVLAGIKKNGLSNNREVFVFYKGHSDTFELVPGNVDTLSPQTAYHKEAKFAWLEDFEDRSISLEPSGVNVTEDSIRLTTDPTEILNHSQNTVSAFTELDTGVQYFENSSIPKLELPRNSAIYLEVNYNLDVKMQVGLYVYTSAGDLFAQIPVLDIFKTEGEWQKTYISLAEDINNSLYTGMDFKVFFAARSSSTTTKSRIYLDNIKLVHF